MRGPHSLPYLLLLPLGACLPPLDRREPPAAAAGAGAGPRWAHPAEGRGPRDRDLWAPSRRPRAPQQPQALLVLARALGASGGGRTGFRAQRQEGSEAAGFLPAREKAAGPLGSLAEELSGFSRKKGGFSFRFGRR